MPAQNGLMTIPFYLSRKTLVLLPIENNRYRHLRSGFQLGEKRVIDGNPAYGAGRFFSGFDDADAAEISGISLGGREAACRKQCGIPIIDAKFFYEPFTDLASLFCRKVARLARLFNVWVGEWVVDAKMRPAEPSVERKRMLRSKLLVTRLRFLPPGLINFHDMSPALLPKCMNARS